MGIFGRLRGTSADKGLVSPEAISSTDTKKEDEEITSTLYVVRHGSPTFIQSREKSLEMGLQDTADLLGKHIIQRYGNEKTVLFYATKTFRTRRTALYLAEVLRDTQGLFCDLGDIPDNDYKNARDSSEPLIDQCRPLFFNGLNPDQPTVLAGHGDSARQFTTPSHELYNYAEAVHIQNRTVEVVSPGSEWNI